MSKSKLRQFIWISALILIAFSSAYIVIYQCFPGQPWVSAVGDLIPLILAVPAVFLAHAFARRNSYLQALRDFWSRLVPTAQTVIQYTHLPDPQPANFASVQKKLSTAIDELRSVFDNVPLRNDSRGLYPYENLKDIKRVVDWLGVGKKRNDEEIHLARKVIIRLWQEMYHAMLSEFDRDVPENPVSRYLANGTSIACLLERGELTEADLEPGIPASNPRPNPTK